MEKTLFKVTGYIALIMGIFYSITIIGLIIGIPLIIGGNKFIAYSEYANNDLIENKSNILFWSIFFMFFTLIGGILGIFGYLQLTGELDNITNSIKKEDSLDKLKKIKDLYDSGAITEEEFNKMKKDLLEK